MKINPYFEVKGKTYEIKRTRYLESEYDRITSISKLTNEQESNFADYVKLESALPCLHLRPIKLVVYK